MSAKIRSAGSLTNHKPKKAVIAYRYLLILRSCN